MTVTSSTPHQRLLRLTRSGTRVAAVDLQHSHRRSAAIFGPVAVPDRVEAIRRLRAMVDAGPALRLCLQPSTTSRRWRRADADIADAVIEVPDSHDPLVLLDRLHRLPESGLRVALAGNYVAIDFSHGLGDTAFCQAVADVVVGAVTLDDPHWDAYRHRVSPLAAAGLATFGSDPRRLWRLGGLHRRRPIPDPGPAGDPHPVSRTAPTARMVRLPADDVARLRTLRDRHRPGVSMFAIYTIALIRALSDAGISLTPAVTIPFDVRPYLPAGIDTLATFSAGLAFPIGPDTAPHSLQALLTESASCGRPVANMLVSTAKIRLASREQLAADHWALVGDTPRADLLHSFVGRLPQTDAIRFLDPAAASNYTVSDPISPRGITVTSAMIGDGALCMSAAFHDEHLDADRIDRAISGIAGAIESTIRTPG